jgi:glycosyltransferase involved in cell wall biosynthesis
LVEANGLRDRIKLVGYRDDIPELLQAADVVVQPSHFDALPTTLIQALAAGVPAVASDVGGIPEIVTSRVGILVPPGRPDRLAQAIDELASDPIRRAALGSAAHAFFEEEFSAVTWVGRLRGVYESVRR